MDYGKAGLISILHLWTIFFNLELWIISFHTYLDAISRHSAVA